MNMKNVLTTFIALCLAAAVALLAYFLQKAHKTTTVVKHEDLNAVSVLVAKFPLSPGEVINLNKFDWGKWPKDSVDPGYVKKENEADLAKLKGAIVRFAIPRGAPLNQNDIIMLGDKSMVTAFVDPGMRAVTIPLSHIDNPSVHFSPGDYIDILLPVQSGQGRPEVNIFIKGVRVIAVDDRFAEPQSGTTKGPASVPKTITVAVDPSQAKLIAESILVGHIVVSQYSAFSPPQSASAKTEEEKKVTVITILRGSAGAKAPIVYGTSK